jgi:hypothetical protein
MTPRTGCTSRPNANCTSTTEAPPAGYRQHSRCGSASAECRALAEMLRQRGIRRVCSASCDVFGVVSVNTDLTIWTNGRVLLWHYGGSPDAYPAADVEGAAERLATLAARMGFPDTWQS